MKLKLLICLSLIFFIEVSDFNYQRVEAQVDMGIKEKGIQKFKNSNSFIIKFSSIIYEKNGKQLKIPIFQGDLGDISYDEFIEYCHKKKYLEPEAVETKFIIKAKKGEMTKTFHEFLTFYKSNILKNTDLNKPGGIVTDGCAPELYYDFTVNGVPFVLYIKFSVDNCDINEQNLFQFKSVSDIKLNETTDKPIIAYRFWCNKTTKDFF